MKTLTALSLASAALPVAASAQVPPVVQPVNGPVVSLSVTEEVDSAPDMATVGTGVQSRAITAREAMALNAAAMDKLIAAILKGGVERKDIQTSGINLNAQYDYGNRTDGQGPRFTGYEASNQVSVKFRKIASVGDIIDRMVAAGATNVNGPSFGIADDERQLSRAREKAIRTAQQRAQFYATQTGYGQVRLIAVSETGDIMRPVPMVMMRADVQTVAAPKTAIEPGRISTSVTLNFQYALEK